jgi:hypothetical protein
VRKHGTIHALRAEDVDVVEFSELFWGKRLCRPKIHVSRVMDHHVDMAVSRDDFCYCAVDGVLRLHVKFDGSQIDFIVLCVFLKLGHLRSVPH